MQRKGAQREGILQQLADMGGASTAAVAQVAKQTGVPEADVWGAGLFYGLLRRDPQNTLVCNGLSCRIQGAEQLRHQLTEQGVATQSVACLGLCDVAPAAVGPALLPLPACDQPAHVLPNNPDLPINLGGERDRSYRGLGAALKLGADAVIAELQAAGLQGRGGAGFPAHLKWRSVRNQTDPTRYVVCNADEGEPGTFKDREVIRRQPDKLLEGLAIAAHVVQATEIYIYLRGEFERERRILQSAIDDACHGPLAGLQFHIVRGQGAYVCGEETALLESLEGRRGMPRLKPPFPTERGFRNKPTLIHNVETLACVPDIALRGGVRFASLGRREPGAKLYCISGHVQRPGVYELPLGVSLDELVACAGGYVGTPQAFSPGGASSGFLPMSERSRPLDFASLGQVGAMLGSAGAVVLNDTADLVLAVHWQLSFFEHESCGQCAPCRLGSRWVRQALDRYLASGDPGELSDVLDVAWEMNEGSICGLGQVASLPLTSAMQHFPEQFGRRPVTQEHHHG